MGLVPKARRDPTTTLVAYALACGVPLAAYLATASAHAHWLDAGEMTAAAIDLDVAHPPGHPLAAIVGHLFTLLPLGPLALRVALAQALCAALACAFLFRALDTTARVFGLRHDRLTIPIALGGTWLVGTAYGWWLQAVRPEVYALEALCVAVVIERVVALEAAWPVNDVRPFYVAALVTGLGLANHHFMMVLVLPALAPTAARVYRAHGGRALAIAGGALLAGLMPYLYLPVRAATSPPLDLGHPTSLERFFWVVSAQVYADPERIATEPMMLRAADVGVMLLENVHALPLVLAAGGTWALLRTPGARRIGYVWLALALFSCAGRAWLGHNDANPDALGYLMPALMAIGALAVAFVAAAMAMIGGASAGAPRSTTMLVALVTAGLGLAQLERSADRASLASFHATDAFDELRVRALPPRAVVITHLPDTTFRHYAARAEEHVRPDVAIVPMTFLAYPGMVSALVARDPGLRPLLRGTMLESELRAADLSSLATERPVLVEMDVRVGRELHEVLVPEGLYYRVIDGGVAAAEVREAAEVRSRTMAGLSRAIDTDGNDAHTRAQILWITYGDALYYAHRGVLGPARDAASRALEIDPSSAELRGLVDALADPELDGPLDVEPFIVGSPPPGS